MTTNIRPCINTVQAERLFSVGKLTECLEICWDLRLEPDLSLYRRALVNLLIATAADVRDHPDMDKFAQECIALVDQIRREGAYSAEDTVLNSLQDRGRSTLAHIQELQEQLKRGLGDQNTEEETLRDVEEIKPSQASRDHLESLAGVKAARATPSSSNLPGQSRPEQLDQWSIEGMYNDLGKGAASEGGKEEDDDDEEEEDDDDEEEDDNVVMSGTESQSQLGQAKQSQIEAAFTPVKSVPAKATAQEQRLRKSRPWQLTYQGHY